jgi:predicted NBD/HSP70 family sugar kinase/mannose-6-phosphate isomerase class I
MSEHFDKQVALGIDIGGSHISAAMVSLPDGQILEETISRKHINTNGSSYDILAQWISMLQNVLSKSNGHTLKGIGISMPGPFDYPKGISLINSVNKYDALFGINLQQALRDELHLQNDCPVVFENDAACFGLGESLAKEEEHQKLIAITLGTGFGATFLHNNEIIKEGETVPPGGFLYNVPYRNGIAEDCISTRGLINTYQQLTGITLKEVKDIADKAFLHGEENAKKAFELFGIQLAECLQPWINCFNADCLIIGGSISKSSSLFLPSLQNKLEEAGIQITIKISKKMELAAITGAASLVGQKEKSETIRKEWRKSSQALMPAHQSGTGKTTGQYNIYPFQSIGAGTIFSGYGSLAEWIATQKLVIIDGYVGTDWEMILQQCSVYFREKNINAVWYQTSAFEKDEAEIEAMVQPFLGEENSVWGKKTTLQLEDFYQLDKLRSIDPDMQFDVNIIIGTGAAICGWNAPVVYFDLPRNELQYRMRAKFISNLGSTRMGAPAEMYKRFYFVDWVVLDNYRQQIKNKIEIIADGQYRTDLTWTFHSSIKNGLAHISNNIIRVRPWFEAGAWGGQWMKKQIPTLNQDEINYAWSFELIVPENGLVFEGDGNLLEVSFHWLMEQNEQAILGRDAARFGTEFPIRFDFLDTFDGGNLSIQCHPSVSYIQKEFGENFTQDETYYILDCKEDASVYLGFQDDIQPTEFVAALQKSVAENKAIDIEKYVQKHVAHKHDLFLIPNQTIHSSAANNLVLEISATPYIFTFKMYDWVRLDLNGQSRPINIEHATKNLDYSRKGKKVQDELISKPAVIEENSDYRLVHLPTHKEHFYDVHRLEFSEEAIVSTNDQAHVLMLVEGQSVTVKTNGDEQVFSFAETFVIPAAAGEYTVINNGTEPVKLIKAFIK